MTLSPRAAGECDLDLVGLGQNSVSHIWRGERHPAPGAPAGAPRLEQVRAFLDVAPPERSFDDR